MSERTKIEAHFGEIKQSRFAEQASQWKQEQSWKERSQHIALELLDFLEEKDLTQKAFAEMMGVSPQVINKWLKGQENFTLETIGKMEAVLKRSLIQVLSVPEEISMVAEVLAPFTTAYKIWKVPAHSTFQESPKVVPITSNYYSKAHGY